MVLWRCCALQIILSILLLVILLVIYIVYKFCKIASNSDNQELEDELFLKIYGHENSNDTASSKCSEIHEEISMLTKPANKGID